MAHSAMGPRTNIDKDIVSSMLAAVSDFVGEAFPIGDGALIERLYFGKQSLHVYSNGPMRMAARFYGEVTPNARHEVRDYLQFLSEHYSHIIDDNWNGSTDRMWELQEDMHKFLGRLLIACVWTDLEGFKAAQAQAA